MNAFEVWARTSPEFKQTIQADAADKAKRLFLKAKGIRPSDYFCGLTNVSAKKMQPVGKGAIPDEAPQAHERRETFQRN